MEIQSQSQFESSSNESMVMVKPKNITQDVSIIRHLPEARQILDTFSDQPKHNNGKCLYENQLGSIPQYLIPAFLDSHSNDKKKQEIDFKSMHKNQISLSQKKVVSSFRLGKLQQTLAEYQLLKDNVQSILANNNNDKICGQKQCIGTLWSLYSDKTPSYSRFGNTAKKNNFANVILNINGIVLPTGTKNRLQNQCSNLKYSDNSIQKANDNVRFDSHFQSGNLLFAYRQNDKNSDIETYDLILQNDINTRGHNQWFYFKIYNAKKHNKIRLNIVNFIKDQSLFSYGIKPLVFSEKDYHRQKIGWVRGGDKINYFQSKIRRQFNNKFYYTATFQYYFKQEDAVYFAPTFPYLYSQLSRYLNNILQDRMLLKRKEKQLQISQNNRNTKNKFIAKFECYDVFSVKTLSQTVGKNPISIITISMIKKYMDECPNKIVWIFGRQHPAETSASYMAQGIVDYLISLYTNPPKDLKQLLSEITFKIVPLLNADGVIHGNTRAQITGIDPNRMWKKPLKRLCPEISALKKAIATTKYNVSLALDLHSHSKKLGCFFYGNSPIHDPKSTKIYPTMVCDEDPRFSIKNCRFRGGYETTARSVIFNQLSITNIYTVQCSLIGYQMNNRIIEFSVQDYNQMGKLLIKSYLNLEMIKKTKKQVQIISDLGRKIPQRDQVDSARSQSSLSDQQYEEIKYKNKTKKRTKKVRKCVDSQNCSQQNQYFVGRNHQRVKTMNKDSSATLENLTQRQSSANKLHQKCYSKQHQETNTIKDDRVIIKKKRILEQISNNRIKTVNEGYHNKRSSQLPLCIPKIQLRSQCRYLIREAHQKQKSKILALKDTNDVDIQVNLTGMTEEHETIKNKIKARSSQDEQYLCVVGSSFEDQFVTSVKNEVGVQVYSFIINGPENKAIHSSYKDSMILKPTKRIPKIINYLCSNLIGVKKQHQLFSMSRKLPNFRNKKFQ